MRPGAAVEQGAASFLGSAVEAVKRYYLIEQIDRLPTIFIPDLPEPEPEVAEPPAAEKELAWPAAAALINSQDKKEVSNGWASIKAVALCNSAGQPCAVFEQGEAASFFFEVELLHDIEVPTGGVELINEKGTIVHGKNTLLYGTSVPASLPAGACLRFRQEIDLEIAVGEYTYSVGIATLTKSDYNHRALLTQMELDAKTTVLTILPQVGQFAVVHRRQGQPVQLLHHGLANLPGTAQVQVILPEKPA